MFTYRVLTEGDFYDLHCFYMFEKTEYVPHNYEEFRKVARHVFYIGGFIDGVLVSALELFVSPTHPTGLIFGATVAKTAHTRGVNRGMFKLLFKVAFTPQDIEYIAAEVSEARVARMLTQLGFIKFSSNDELTTYILNRNHVLPRMRY